MKRALGTRTWLRRAGALLLLALLFLAALASWHEPGLLLTDGRHDPGRNALWLQHAWLGDDSWFERVGRSSERLDFRDRSRIRRLEKQLHTHRMHTIFPHLAPTSPDGALPPHDVLQTERLLTLLRDVEVLPWVGGVRGEHAFPDDPAWRTRFASEIRALLLRHPELDGIHLNIEPWDDGDLAMLTLLDDLREALPSGRQLSVATSPPGTGMLSQPGTWSSDYLAEVDRRVDQLTVMLYNQASWLSTTWRARLVEQITEIFAQTEHARILLGLPAFPNEPPYHDAEVESLESGLRATHAALARLPTLPERFDGIAVYAGWTMKTQDWKTFHSEWALPPSSRPP